MKTKVKIIQVILLVGILLMHVLLPTVNALAIDECVNIKFEDENMYKYMKQLLNEDNVEMLTNDETLTISMRQEDIDSVTSINIEGYGRSDKITDVTGIEKFRNLKYLSITLNKIKDITPISKLEKLYSLKLQSNEIESIDSLSECSSLHTLELGSNKIENIDGISKLTELTGLDLSNNQIKDITEIAQLTKLDWLYLSSNQIEDMSPVYELPDIDFEHSGPTNVGWYGEFRAPYQNIEIFTEGTTAELPQLFIDATNSDTVIYSEEGLTFENCSLSEDERGIVIDEDTDVGIVTIADGLAKGSTYKCYRTRDLRFEDENLYYQILENTYVMYNANEEEIQKYNLRVGFNLPIYRDDTTLEFKALQYCMKNKLEIKKQGIKSLSGLEEYVNLKNLNIGTNDIEDLTPLTKLKHLESLLLSDNPIKDYSVLSQIKSLESIYLSKSQQNEIDLNIFTELPVLRILSLYRFDVENIEKLQEIETLENLSIQYADLNDNDLIQITKIPSLNHLELKNDNITSINNLSTLNGIKWLDLGYNHISDISILENMGIEYLYLNSQKLETTTDKKEVKLPQIFRAAKDSNSIVYMGDEVEYVLTNCTISDDGTKVILNNDAEQAEVKIPKGKASYSTFKINYAGTVDPDPNPDLVTIQFKDENMYNAIIEELERQEDCEIDVKDNENLKISLTQEKIDDFIQFDPYTTGKIYDISGIEYFKNLESLQIFNGQIEDISPISNLTNLKTFYFQCGDNTNLNNLSGLINLEYLALWNYKASDISFVSNMKKLNYLYISGPVVQGGELIENIEALSELTELQSLTLPYSNITDISPLAKLTKLQSLYLPGSSVTDISALSNLTNIEDLNFGSSVKIEDISPLLNLKDLKKLYFSYQDMDDISFYKNFKKLEEVDISRKVKDISVLSGLKNLQKIGLFWCMVEDIDPIESMPDTVNITAQEQNLEEVKIAKGQKEVNLPDIFISAQNKDSKGYSEEGLYLENCRLSDDGTKIIINDADSGEYYRARVIINSGSLMSSEVKFVEGTEEEINQVRRIKVTTLPEKMEYLDGETFDRAGMKVIAIYNDESRHEITDYTIEAPHLLTVDDNAITISYTKDGKTVRTTIYVDVTKTEDDLEVDTTDLEKVVEDGITYIDKVQPNVVIEEIKEKISTNGEIKVFDKDAKEITDDNSKVTTGTKIVITKGEETVELIMVVKGDTNGSGTADFSDMLKMNKHRLGKLPLEGAFFKAGDIDGNGIVNFSDMLKVNKFRLHKVDTL